MIDLLKKSVEQEIEILREISLFSKRIETASPSEKTLLAEGLEALNSRMRESSRIVIDLLGEIETGIKKKKFLEELDITEGVLKKLRKKEVKEEAEIEEFRKARGYLKLANKFFFKSANDLVKKGYFGALQSELKKSNLI